MIKTVIKRDGTKQPFDGAKLADWVKWASKDIDTQYIDWSGVVLKVISLLPEEVTSQELQRVLIKTCVDKGTYEYTKMAGRLLAASLPKEFYLERKYLHIKDLHKRMEDDGLIVKPNYTDEEYNQINQMLNHEKDFTYEEYAINHAINKNSLWNKKTKKKYETPQFIFMRVVMQIFNNYHEKDRMEKIKDLYELVSDRKINVPTPYFSSSLTKNSSVSSCAVVLAKDTAQSIGVSNTLVYELTTKGAGLGMQMNIRSLGDEVRGGMISHQGKVPYYRAIGDIIKSSKQGCYDKETEVLTKEGWKFFKEVTEDDLIAQIDSETFVVSYAKPKRIVAYKHTGDMYHFKAKSKKYPELQFDLLVTPDHRMLYSLFKDGERVHNKLSEEYAETFELSMNESGHKGMLPGGFIDTEKRTEEVKLKTLSEYKDEVKEYSKEEFSWVKPSTRSYMWLWVFLHNETIKQPERVFTKEQIDVLQEATALCFLYSLVTEVVGGYKFSINTNKEVISFEEQISSKEKVHYDDYVYCVEVPTNNLIVRRNSITAVCGNSRGGALTMYVPVLDPEIITIANLKNPTSTEANRVRTIDYGVCLNNYFLEKVAKNENTYLFSVKDNEELNQLFFKDPDNKFEEKLEEFAKNNPDKVKEVKARDILRDVLVQSLETGRIYLFFTDNNNTHTPYNDTIYNSNLCCEISLPTKPFETYSDLYRTTSLTPVKEGEYDLMLDNGQVAFCNLAGLEVSRLYDNDEEYEKAAYYALLMIDEGINNAELGFPALNKSIRDWRSAGVSMIGLAHLLARKHLDYTSKEGKQFIHDLAEKNYYFLLKAAIRLTKERGVTPASSHTKWIDGWLPIDTYKKTVDEIVPNELKQDWETLRNEVKSLKGLRFTTLSTIVPSEVSSLMLGTSNSVLPVRKLLLVKQNGDNAVTWIAPDATKLKHYYQSAWNIPQKDMIEVYALIQKFTDQGISADMWYDRSEQLEIPVSTLMQHTLWMNKYGMKGRYYVNSKTEKDLDLTVAATNIDRQNFETDEDKGCGSGGCTL
jgi:ribonucleoside-diphosphate reductase alpha subunit